MKQLIFVRYGQYEDGHLTKEGVETMNNATQKLLPFVTNKNFCLVCADVPRAIESAQIIAKTVNTNVTAFPEFYAADEENKLPDCKSVGTVIKSLWNDYDVIVAIMSREYIETLPEYLLDKKLNTHLERGECLLLDLEDKSISYL